MILEIAILDVKPGQGDAFEADFGLAESIIASMPGYISHQLQRCIETSNRYILLVNWQTLSDHTEGFRGSSEYEKWRQLLGPRKKLSSHRKINMSCYAPHMV